MVPVTTRPSLQPRRHPTRDAALIDWTGTCNRGAAHSPVPQSGVAGAGAPPSPAWAGLVNGWQADERIIAQASHGFQRDVAGTLDRFSALGGDDVLAYQGGFATVGGGTGADTLDFAAFEAAVWCFFHHVAANDPVS